MLKRYLPTAAALYVLWGAAPFALAQSPSFPQTLPPNTVMGRTGISPGPAQAIPIAQLKSNLVIAFADLTGQATLAQLPSIATLTALCNVTGGTAVPTACSKAQLTTLINPATASLSGAMPAWPNNTTTFLRGDDTFATLNCAALGGVAASCATDATNASNIATGTLALARMATIAADNLYGNPTGSTAVPQALPLLNCANSLTYSTSSHAFGCNSLAGTGTVTSVATAGLATGGPVTSTGTITVSAASKADEQAGSSATVATTPSQQQQHPSAAKAWAYVTQSGGTYTLQASYNVASINKTGTGQIEVNFTNGFTSANWGNVCSSTGVTFCSPLNSSGTKSTVQLLNSSTQAFADANFSLIVFGTQ